MGQPDSGEGSLNAALEKMGPHDHLCSIYDTREEQYAVAVPFMKIGLERGEKCIYIAETDAVEDARTAMANGGIDVDRALRSGALVLTTKEQTYMRRGVFNPDWMFSFWSEAADGATAEGFPALRATGETEWVMRGGPGLERWMEYESRLTHMLAGGNCFALCQYNRPRFVPELILDVIRTHPIVIYRGTLCRNFYFVPADEFLGTDRAAREVERLLTNIRDRERMDGALRGQQAALQSAHDELEQRVRQRTAELREREEWLRLAQKTAGLGIADWDIQTGRARVSEEFRRLYDLDATVETLSQEDWLERIHPEDRSRARGQMRTVVAGAGPAEIQFRVPGRNGSERWVSSTARLLAGTDGTAARVLSTSMDITERKRAEEARYAAQKMESIGVLAGGLAHDFNNLLVGVIGGASLAADLVPPDSPALGLLDRIVKAGEQAAYLTRQMLAYSGRGQFLIEAVDLAEMVRETESLVRSSISKKISLEVEAEPGLPPVVADRSQMQQAFMNLAMNAAEAIGDAAGRIRVRIGSENLDQEQAGRAGLRPGGYVCLEVRDTGCGMDTATRARIFDPFFTTKFTGRGLGLAAVSGIVRTHQGSVEVSSAPGQGSGFRILLPAGEREPAAAEPAVALQPDLRGSGTILVVDDEAVVRETARQALVRYGYRVIVAGSGRSALALFAAEPVSLVVLDLSMPGLSGPEVVPGLQEIRPDVPILISSGYTEAEIMPLFEGYGVAGFIQKPYTPARLAGKVKVALAAGLEAVAS